MADFFIICKKKLWSSEIFLKIYVELKLGLEENGLKLLDDTALVPCVIAENWA